MLVGTIGMGLYRNLVFEWHKISPMFVSSALDLEKPVYRLSSSSVTWVMVLLSGAYLSVPFCLFLFLYAALQSLSGAIPCHNVPCQFLSCIRHVKGGKRTHVPSSLCYLWFWFALLFIFSCLKLECNH